MTHHHDELGTSFFRFPENVDDGLPVFGCNASCLQTLVNQGLILGYRTLPTSTSAHLSSTVLISMFINNISSDALRSVLQVKTSLVIAE